MKNQTNTLTQEEDGYLQEVQALTRAAQESWLTNPQEAHGLACKAQELAASYGFRREWALSTLHMGVIDFMLNNEAEGKASLLAAREVFHELGDTIGEISTVQSLGNYYIMSNNYTAAIETFTTALQLSDSIGDTLYQAGTLNNLGLTYNKVGDWRKALECYKQTVYLLDNIDNAESSKIEKSEYVRQGALNNIGGILDAVGDLSGAIEHYVQSLHIAQRRGDQLEEMRLFHNLGNLCRQTNNLPDAIAYCQKSLAIAESIGVTHNMFYPLVNLGIALLEAGDIAGAATHMERSLTLAREIGNKGSEAYTLAALARLYKAAKQPDKVLPTLEYTIGMYRELGDYEGELGAMLSLSEQYSAMGQAAQALPLLEQGLSMAEQLQSRLYVFRACRDLSSVYKQLGDYQQALAYHERYHAVEKEVFNEESDKKVQALMVQVQMERTEHERELYRSKAELLEQEVEFKRRELASHTLHLVERDKLIRTTERYLEKLQLVVSQEDGAELKKILRMLKNSRQDSAGWDVFDEKFQELHGEFTGRLSGLYPALSPSEVKVCVLMKLHLSTKEIAAVLHTGVRTVEAHRYRLRKKLGIDGEVNLVSWLNAL